MDKMRFFLLRPEVVLRARVNQPTAATYPVQAIPYDNVTEGSAANVKAGSTIFLGSGAGLDTYGQQRVQSTYFPSFPDVSTGTIFVGRSSQGTRAGEMDVVDDAHITVFDDYRVWAKIGYVDTLGGFGTIYKDGNVAVGTNTSQPPPVANAGVPAVGTIDSVTEKLRVKFPHVANSSFATANSATISTYGWELPAGVTLAPGYSATDSQIEADFPAGFHWVRLSVTDSNSKAHIANTFVLAIDPADDPSIAGFQVASHSITPEGQTVAVRIFDDIPQWNGSVGYPDGTLAVLWEGEPSSADDRSNLIFWGWHEGDAGEISAGKTGTAHDVTIQCVDVGGRLKSLPGFSVSVMNDSLRDSGVEAAITWAYMTDPNMDKFLHYLLHWHSTALEVANWTWSGTATTMPFSILEAGAENLFDQVDSKARALTPDYRFVCDRLGRIAIHKDPMVEDPDERTATEQGTMAVDDWTQVSYSQRRRPQVYQLRESGLLAHATALTALFSLAPGTGPGQGETLAEQGNQLAASQEDLNVTSGQRYARLNALDGPFLVRLPGAATYDPAQMTWVRLQVTSDIQAQLRLRFLEARGLISRMAIEYNYTRTGLVRATTIEWEREVFGMDGITSSETWT